MLREQFKNRHRQKESLNGFKFSQVFYISFQGDNEFQNEHGYDKDEKGKADLSIASNYISNTVLCPSMTIEMPFKDNDNAPNVLTGWSPERSQQFAQDTVDAIFQFYQGEIKY
ncbi:hypothetical protein L3V82_10755 [Thiotrichales bacterium 19S3-7]|nr:hypothetical protein [Thiotrichales bacterium 19S3-7]MCF6802637.1 hypothetical protein [Thiotrichales bacterium 19S3-11]